MTTEATVDDVIRRCSHVDMSVFHALEPPPSSAACFLTTIGIGRVQLPTSHTNVNKDGWWQSRIEPLPLHYKSWGECVGITISFFIGIRVEIRLKGVCEHTRMQIGVEIAIVMIPYRGTMIVPSRCMYGNVLQ